MIKYLLNVLVFYMVLSFASVQGTEAVLTIKSNKTHYVLGEPVILYVSLQNTSEDRTVLPSLLDPMSGFVRYRLKPLGENSKGTTGYFSPWAIGDFLGGTTEFAPGEFINEEVKLFFGATGWLFRVVGSYEITAEMPDHGLFSNTIKITVQTPTDDATTKAAQLFLESDEAGFFLFFEAGDHLTEGIQRLEQVATQYPNTLHATYANQALGARLVDDFANMAEGHIRPKDPASALPYLVKAKQKPVSFYDTLHTHLLLYEAYTQLNKTIEAKSAIKNLVQISSTLFEDFLPFLEDILKIKGITIPEINQTSCLLYAVHDKAQKENQFFTVNWLDEEFEVKPLGWKHHGHDISLVAANFDDDDDDEIALATKQGGHTVTLHELDGTFIRSFPISVSSISLAAGDINGNGTAEIIAASRASNNDSVFVYAADGTALTSVAMFDKNTRMSSTVGNIDGDSMVDIIAGRLLKEDQVAIYNSASQELHHFFVFQSVLPPHNKPNNTLKNKGITYGVQVASDDFNDDGKDDIIVAMASKGSQVEVYSSEGTFLKAFLAFDKSDGVVVAAGNVIGDGQPEIIVGEAKGTQIRGFNLEGEKVFEFKATEHGTVSSLVLFRCEEKKE